jgi:hypothetical protein
MGTDARWRGRPEVLGESAPAVAMKADKALTVAAWIIMAPGLAIAMFFLGTLWLSLKIASALMWISRKI